MFCVICFEDCICLFRRRDKEIYSKCANAEIEKERVQRDKNGNMNNAAFYTEVTSYEHRIQNICTRNTMSHIEARARVGRPQTSSSPPSKFYCRPSQGGSSVLVLW